MMFLTATAVQAQIVIGGSVYGGGNAGDTGGKTTVNVYAGDIHAVFAGARMANIGGSAFVHIDGEHATSYILADYVYGGNDIAGTIGTSANLPTELTQVGTEAGKNNIDNTWNAFVRISTKMSSSNPTVPDETQKTYIGQLFGGGNGYYEYVTDDNGTIVKDKVTDETIVSSTSTLSSPQLAKTYLEILGGSIVYAYGGGNDATVTDKTIICLDNPSKVVGSIIDDTNPNANTDSEKGTVGELLNDARFEKMRINTTFSYPNSEAFQIGRLFGGNNKADMAIRPRWNLKRGKVRNLYGGGNEGRMTSPEGLLLQVDGEGMVVDNVYGGCRKADVRALDRNGTPIPYENIQLDPSDNPNNIPGGYAARVRILKGDVTNVYGGNDISGNIYGGCTVGILTSVHGDVYGGGNGSYAYTDNAKLKDDPKYSDFYYSPKEILNLSGNSFTGLQSAEALNIFRPNAERVSILVRGTPTKPTVVEGALYVGGNSASLRSQSSNSSNGSNMTHVKVGSYVIIDNVFLGNNGENMIKYNEADAEGRGEGVLRTLASTQKDPDGNDAKFSQMDLTKPAQFNKYMEGCAMKVNPTVVFESIANGDKVDYDPYSTKFGSLFCGGNVGSIIVPGKIKVDFNDKIIIYDKVVGGCNNANVYQTAYNAEYLGGIMGDATAAPEGSIGDKLELNFGGLKIQPMRWKIQRNPTTYEPILDDNNKEQYVVDANGNRFLEWNTVDSRTFNTTTKKYKPMAPVAAGSSTTYDSTTDLYRRFQGGNIYGGCYNSGHVNGNVIINIDSTLVDRKGENSIFDQVEENEGEAKLYDGNYHITQRYTGVLLGEQGMDPLGRALNVFGGGYGGDSEIWGSATINLNAGYAFQVFGGGEQGAIGQAIDHTPNPNDPTSHNLTYDYNENYSTYINLRGKNEGVYRGHENDKPDMAEVEFIYGGSFEGLIAGSTHINLGNGRIFNSFAGSCNADILGHTETYVGRQANDDGTYTDGGGFPWIRDHIYGGNDLGGRILNTHDFMDRVSSDIRAKVYNPTGKTVSNTDSSPDPDVVKASAYTEYIQGRVEFIFGGCYGDYDYRDSHYSAYAYSTGSEGQTTENLGTMRDGYYKPWMCNAFVNFKPNSHNRNAVDKIYGAGQGHAYAHQSDYDRDAMQDRSYVLIDIPQTITKYQGLEVFGAGDYSGVGMRNTTGIEHVHNLTPAIAQTNADGVTASTVIDLVRGQIYAAFGGSYKEGFTRRTILNVPTGSTIQFKRIFGGAYGLKNDVICDVYDANINYSSGDAVAAGDQTVEADFRINPTTGEKEFMSGAVFGGNNSYGRTLYSKINIESAVVQDKATGYSSRVFGGGYGSGSWSQYTEINLKNGASVYEVYGGGYGGKVYNKETVFAWQAELDKNNQEGDPSNLPLDLGKGYEDEGLDCYLVKTNPLGTKTNTNVYINKGATVWGYCYGGGLGADATVSGTTYIGLHGGTVNKDLYAGGWGGGVFDEYKVAKDTKDDNDFIATTNAYIEGGTVRNVYGGGYQGSVGYHNSSTTATTDDILGVTNVVIGIRKDQNLDFTNTSLFPDGYGIHKGVPAIQRNAYGAGEGGAVFGTANLTLNNAYIGYTYNTTTEKYVEKLDDETWTDGVGKDRLKDCGNVFGAGYDDKSSCDFTNITMWGGTVRNSVIGGGEIATVGRGKTTESGENNKDRVLEAIYKAGKTNLEIYNGHIKRNVFGGGKGYNTLGYGGVHGLYTDGYVFGQTEVHVHGGEIGTDEGLAEGYGNVFGGGDVGYVYSKGYFSTKTTTEKTNNPGGSTGSPNHWYYYDDAGNLTEDCKVVIAPMLQIKKNGTTVTFNEETYGPYDYVPTDYLNTLPADKTNAGWTNLYTGSKTGDDQTERGVHIHNAVFAGGNVSSNNESYANATTVFGNTSATLYDVYHHDFITVGTEHTGGLYGGGNLSVVGGYRELNITNYGTDYYGLNQRISLDEYYTLTNRERAYFKLEYVCQTPNNDYKVGERIDEDKYNALPSSYKTETYWKMYGFCSIYAGRLLNTIQRADFCGVYGSRLVLQGAKDRVADVADATEYTINRIGEVSLNQQHSMAGDTDEKAIHGNYFGIYSVVNYLGNLTSDVEFTDLRRYVQNEQPYVDTQSYYNWKTSRLEKHDRNNGTAYNQVALASGVFLELTTEKSTPSKKIYGDITGVVELDLINVKKDIEGGGYVYARNEHRIPKYFAQKKNVLLSEYNKPATLGGQDLRDEARTYKRYIYSQEDENQKISSEDGSATILGSNTPYTVMSYQTSGNFIHKSKRIVDDCYPTNGVYQDNQGLYVTSPAHYWFIKGSVYIYDQVVSAYAGSAAAYSKEVKIPLTITAGSNGKLKLLNVQPSLYAYYSNYEQTEKIGTDGVKVDNESMTYKLNDVITWWDWHQLSTNEQKYFVKETYVNVDTCTVAGVPYAEGTYVMLPNDSVEFKTNYIDQNKVLDKKGNPVTKFYKLFRSSNNISHETGYVLTLDMNSPKDWDDWYSPITGSSTYSVATNGTVTTTRKTKEEYKDLSSADKEGYREGPTFKLKDGESAGLYGQRNYSVGEIITKEVYDDYTTTVSQMGTQPTGQATTEPAYVALEDYNNMQAGNPISEEAYLALSETDKKKFAPAKVCVNTIQIGDEEYILMGDLVSGNADDLTALAQKYRTYNNAKINADQLNYDQALEYVQSRLSNAYYIKTEGLYGGQYFQTTQNYGAIKSWCSLTDARNHFDYNYDALDVLVDKDYHGEGNIATYYKSPYSDVKSVEYRAFNTRSSSITYSDNDGTEHELAAGGSIGREDYEKVRNDQLHYTRLSVDAGSTSDKQKFYIIRENIIDKGTPYAKGQDISERDFNDLTTANQEKVAQVEIQRQSTASAHYYCYEDYTTSATFTPESGEKGKAGSIISSSVFSNESYVPNYQKLFSIQGAEPTETTTLYVSRESNAKDVTSEKVISVVYQYTYYEPDDEGDGVSLVNELHVLNIRLQLESGAPEIGPLTAPPAVLPGNTVGLKAPTVNPGLYEILTNGWELFNSEEDAQMQRNGIPFTNNGTPLYWYQNQKVFLAFYSKTYLGKTYSNYVPLTVANYHDLDAVMKDKEHHLYVDHPGVARNSKIYIDNRTCESDATKSELDLLKDFFDLSLQTTVATEGATKDHAVLDGHVRAGRNLDFILNSDVSPKKYTTWIPIGYNDIADDPTTTDVDEAVVSNGQCFDGTLHGDGYTISGLSNSLFDHLCGEVYNLGVTGSFTSAGIANTGGGYVENCWVKSSAETVDNNVKAVFGNPSRGKEIQLVNCYYPKTNEYSETVNARGNATKMSETEFYNGTVAFNLNGFYLNKRYHDKQTTSGTEYKYLKDENGTLSENPLTGYYPAEPDAQYGDVGYVERRYADGDFVYAGGTIPEANDERMRVVTVGTASTVTYAPIWPDDYIYFGQMLTYGHSASQAHQDWPTRINKSSNRLPVSEASNRVFRAPAYYESKTMGVAHYNLYAYLAAKSAPKTVTDKDLKDAYPNMTAIDFAGHNDNTWSLGGTTKFYPPLLDDDGLLNIINEGETPNLLVYAPLAEVNQKTLDVLTGYFADPTYVDYYQSGNYRCVTQASASDIHGHLVQATLTDGKPTATNDHLLVDKQPFNCPISYQFASDKRMWYQRMPERYVDITKGWETVSLPFTAELVTTNEKGEITHFYSGSTTVSGKNINDQNKETKIGHEYWLREYKGGAVDTNDANIFKSTFNYPDKTGSTKTVNNTFLWDHYYSNSSQKDANTDTYQTYYKTARDLAEYPLLSTAKPYIIGFPGKTYYEFDLSGEWTPSNTATPVPGTVGQQTITFASAANVSIGISDDEVNGIAADGYTFMPNYMNKALKGYHMNTVGDRFEKGMSTTEPAEEIAVTTVPFRPYFVATPTNPSPAPRRADAQYIIFDRTGSSFAIDDDDPSDELAGELAFSTKPRKLITTSSLRHATDVRIFSTSGQSIASFTIQPGETIETDIPVAGVYIIRAANGRYTKKFALK